jgi:CO/xanthine dehydrogenase FAD-binding subunit
MEIFRPNSLNELLSTYASHPEAFLMAGGIELMKMDETAPRLKTIIDLAAVEDLKRISRTERHMDIGPSLPFSHILSIGRHVIPRVLHDALDSIFAPAIKNMATLGGNLCLGSPHSASLTALTALEAQLELRSVNSTRWISATKFVPAENLTDLRKGEVLTRIRIPLESWSVQVFRSSAESLIVFCGLANILKGVIQDIRFSIGSVNPTVIRDRKLETPLIGHKMPLQDREIGMVTSALSELLVPIADSPSQQVYQVETSRRMIRWFLKNLKHLDRTIL